MTNPIAFVIRPSRAFLLCMSLIAGYGSLLGLARVVADCPCIEHDDVGFDDVSPVELLE